MRNWCFQNLSTKRTCNMDQRILSNRQQNGYCLAINREADTHFQNFASLFEHVSISCSVDCSVVLNTAWLFGADPYVRELALRCANG